MKIATFNIKNVVRWLPYLLDWLRGSAPDVVCLQELKATDASFPEAVLQDTGYAAVWRGQGSWNGGAILARARADPGPERAAGRSRGQAEPLHRGGRRRRARRLHLAAERRSAAGPKFDYKLAWFGRLIAHAAELHAAGVPAVIAGDYNVVRPIWTSIRPSPGRTTRCCSRKAGRRSGPSGPGLPGSWFFSGSKAPA